MRYFLQLLILLLICSTHLPAQPPRLSNRLNLFRSGFALENGLGFSTLADPDAALLAAQNPAALTAFTRPAAGVSMHYRSDIHYSPVSNYEILLEDLRPLLPYAAGVVLPYDRLRIGAGFQQQYAVRADFGEAEVVTINDPGGTGETYRLVSETTAYSAALQLAYELIPFGETRHHLSLGGHINLDFFRRSDDIFGNALGKATRLNWTAGIRYGYGNLLALGIFYRGENHLSGTIKHDPPFLVPGGDPDSTGTGMVTRSGSPFEVLLPARIAAEIALNPLGRFSVTTHLSRIYWENISPETTDQLDLTMKMIFRLKRKLALMGGVYITDRRSRRYRIWRQTADRDEARFLFAGARMRLGGVTLSLLLADSHWWATDPNLEQTIVRMGIEYRLE